MKRNTINRVVYYLSLVILISFMVIMCNFGEQVSAAQENSDTKHKIEINLKEWDSSTVVVENVNEDIYNKIKEILADKDSETYITTDTTNTIEIDQGEKFKITGNILENLKEMAKKEELPGLKNAMEKIGIEIEEKGMSKEEYEKWEKKRKADETMVIMMYICLGIIMIMPIIGLAYSTINDDY